MRYLKITIPLLSLLILSTSCISKWQQPSSSPYQTPVTIGTKKIFVEIVETPEAKRKGLAGREKLADNEGMLFDFRNVANKKPAFWMKDMKFDIDIIWIKENTVIGIERNVPPPQSSFDRLPLYQPPSEIDFVLEVNGGWSELYIANVGSKIKFD